MSIGLAFPIGRSTGSLGYFRATEDDESAARSDLLALIVTNWGERPMRFNLGCNLIEFLFEQDRDQLLREKISDRIRSQAKRWTPFVVVENVGVVFSDEDPSLSDNSFRVRVVARPAKRNRSFVLEQVFPP